MRSILAFVLASATLLSALEMPVPMEDKKPVSVEPNLLGTKYRQDANPLQVFSMHRVLSIYPESKDAVSASKLWLYPGMALGGVGGFLVGYMAVQPLVGGEFNAPVFFGGVGAVGLSILCGKMSERRLNQAVESYNRALGGAGFRWDLSPDGYGLQLVRSF